jgi:hypothetical protein
MKIYGAQEGADYGKSVERSDAKARDSYILSFSVREWEITRTTSSLKESEGYAHFKLAHSIEDLECLAHVHEISRIV